jgi:Xaa-Pro aminopeptidase
MMDYKKRINKLMQLIREKDLDGVIIGDRASVRYFTGIRLNTASFSILYASRNEKIIYLTEVLDYNRIKRNCWIGDIRKFPEDSPNYLKPLEKVLRENKIERLGIEFNSTTIERERIIRQVTRSKLVPIDKALLELRSIKDDEEVKLIKRAAEIVDKGMEDALKQLKVGLREYELAAIAQATMIEEGAEGLSFEPFVMSGINSWLPQRFSSTKKINKGELIVFDVGCVYKGYCSDLTRTFSLGGLAEDQKDIFRAAFEAQKRALESVKPEMRAKEIDQTARNYIIEEGYGEYFPHLTGHGLGLSEHELPIIDKDSKAKLKLGMVLTIEPGIYIKGIGGARIEDMVLVTREGHEVLTNSTRELVY